MARRLLPLHLPAFASDFDLLAANREHAEALLTAVRRGDTLAIKKMLDEEGVPVGSFHPSVGMGCSALQTALIHGQNNVVRFLLDWDRQQGLARGHLHYHCQIGKADRFVNLRRRDVTGWGTLGRARDPEALFWLLEHDPGCAVRSKALERVDQFLQLRWSFEAYKRLVDDYGWFFCGNKEQNAMALGSCLWYAKDDEVAERLFWFLVREKNVDAGHCGRIFFNICAEYREFPRPDGAARHYEPFVAFLAGELGMDVDAPFDGGASPLGSQLQLKSNVALDKGKMLSRAHLAAMWIRWGASLGRALRECDAVSEHSVLRDPECLDIVMAAVRAKAMSRREAAASAYYTWRVTGFKSWETESDYDGSEQDDEGNEGKDSEGEENGAGAGAASAGSGIGTA